MAIGQQQLLYALSAAGGPSQLPRMLMSAELAPIFKDPANWAELCEFAIEVDKEHGFSNAYQHSFRMGESARSALEDNYIFAAIAAVKVGAHKSAPVVAWAASNKHSFPGLTDGRVSEIAVMRFLQWAGADVSMAEENAGMSPLHYMAQVNYGQASHPGAVRWLLNCGAEPNAKNANGDTPMTFLCGVESWSDAQRETFLMLLKAGCNPLDAANDGSTPMSMLRLTQGMRHDPDRQALIDSLERDLARPRPGFFSKLVGVEKNNAWVATLAH